MRFTQGIARRPARSLVNGLTTQDLGKPDIDLALAQHAAYVAALAECGVEMTVLDADESFPDSCFVEDPAIIWNGVAIMTRPGAISRRGEVAKLREILAARLPVVDLGGGDDALVDGGDVLFCGEHALIGISERTNLEGARRLGAVLHEIDPGLDVTEVPIAGVLHLKTGMTALTPTMLLHNPTCQMQTAFPFAQTVDMPPEQGYAANVRPVNDGVIISQGFPAVAALAREHVSRVNAVNMSEFRKMDGSLTCLSLLW